MINPSPRAFGRVWLLLTVLTPNAFASQSQTSSPASVSPDEMIARVAPIIEERVAKGVNVGFAIGVIDAGERAMAFFGRKSLDRDDPPNAETLFEVGSVSKTFTGLLFADLVVRGQLALDDPIRKWLPAAATRDIGPAGAIDLLSLAVHRSGLPRLIIGAEGDYIAEIARGGADEVYRFLQGYDHRDQAGTKVYSNAGMELLGHILELRTHQQYAQLLEDRITSPLGMSRTSIYIGDRRDNVAMPYVHNRNGDNRTQPARGFFYNRFSPASGGVVSSLADMLTYVHAHLNPETVADETLRDAIRLTRRHYAGDPVEKKNGNGIAWGRNQGRGTTAIYFDHDGLTIGHTTFILFSPELNRGVVLLANTGFYGEHFSEFRRIGYEILRM